MNQRHKMTEQEKQAYKTALLMLLPGHVGKSRRIGMGELFEKVFHEDFEHRINDTRRLRKLVTELRHDGVAICSVADRSGGGYYLASAGSELNEYCQKLRAQALKKLKMESKIRKITMGELLGQMRLDEVEGSEVQDLGLEDG